MTIPAQAHCVPPARPDTAAQGPFLIITGHDFRSPRKASIHFIAAELSRRGPTRVFSLGFSYLSPFKKDPRLSLWDRANRIEVEGGVACYLWRTALHPFNLRRRSLDGIAAAWFRHYATRIPDVLRQWVRESGTIILESGLPPILAAPIRGLNPDARLLYLVSDSLATIGCAPFVAEELARTATLYDAALLPSRHLKDDLPPDLPTYLVPHGLDPEVFRDTGPSPYGPGLHAVSVGSMLFDAGFFAVAAAAFPAVTFHVIGAGVGAARLSAPNIRIYDEMPFRETISYIKHAAFGIAPYEGDRVAPYLADTSMKLMQYGYLGVPAVCPHAVTGEHSGRFGYAPGNVASIVAAIRRALDCGPLGKNRIITWSDVVDQTVNPTNVLPPFGQN